MKPGLKNKTKIQVRPDKLESLSRFPGEGFALVMGILQRRLSPTCAPGWGERWWWWGGGRQAQQLIGSPWASVASHILSPYPMSAFTGVCFLRTAEKNHVPGEGGVSFNHTLFSAGILDAHKNVSDESWAPWLTLVIPALWEANVGGSSQVRVLPLAWSTW